MAVIRCATCQQPLTVTNDGSVRPCTRCANAPGPSDVTAFDPLRNQPLGTTVSSVMPTVLALVTCVIFYAAGPLTTLRETAVYGIFCGHGWVPYVASFLFCNALWILLLKLSAISREFKVFELQLLPEDEGAVIDRTHACKILERIARLTPQQQRLMLVSRIRMALVRLNQLGGSERVDELLKHRADMDVGLIESSYATPKFIIWAIPVLGFVGTVIGISHGVSAFSSLIQNAADLDGLRESLKGVTYGLGQAFETTMVALCMSLLLMLLMSFLQKREDRLLISIDGYCVEHLLHKAEAVKEGGESAEIMSLLRKLLIKMHEASDAPAGQTVRSEMSNV